MARKATKTTRSAAGDLSAAGQGFLDWGPVLGGAALALAISTVLFQFGATAGLAADAPLRGEGQAAMLSLTAIGIWLVWVPLVSVMAGGYVAGALRQTWPTATQTQIETRDGMHGLIVWATATIGAAAGAALLGAIATGTEGDVVAVVSDTATARDITEQTKIVVGFATAAGSILAAGVAWWAATLGGDHRDNGVDVQQFVPGFLR